MKINIFQFLKQGTSLNRKSMNSNSQLEKKIIYNKTNEQSPLNREKGRVQWVKCFCFNLSTQSVDRIRFTEQNIWVSKLVLSTPVNFGL